MIDVPQRRLCTECDTVHDFPVPQFTVGQLVRLVRRGFHHNDKIGNTATITGVNRVLSMPCDPVEYFTTFGNGSIGESRLESITQEPPQPPPPSPQ